MLDNLDSNSTFERGGLMAFAALVLWILRSALADQKAINVELRDLMRQLLVSINGLASEVRELRGDVTPPPRPAFVPEEQTTPPLGGRYHQQLARGKDPR